MKPQLEEKIKKYRIKHTNIYNFDEKGFLLGICRTTKRILPIDHLKKQKTLGSSQDGSREFISLIATICADGSAIPPALIYQGESHDLRDSWLEDFDHSADQAHFAASDKGWTSNNLGISWLTSVFERYTSLKVGNGYRLLLADGHSSHLNMQFIDFCDSHRIILAILPPHSTHRLQPLDVGIFSPLATTYSIEINRLFQSSSGFTRITKRNFWPIFNIAWKKVLTMNNIRSAFEATGIYPIQPSKVLDHLKKTPSPISSDSEIKRKTPGSVRGIQRTLKAISKDKLDITAGLELIAKASEKLAIRADLMEHENRGLRQVIINEKRHRKKGKAMGLLAKNEPGQAMFFSPAKIGAIREQVAAQDAQREQDKIKKDIHRQEKAIEKKLKLQKAQERREERLRTRAEKQEEKKRAEHARAEARLAANQLQNEQQKQEIQARISHKKTKRKAVIEEAESSKRPRQRIGRNGRNITLPIRYLN